MGGCQVGGPAVGQHPMDTVIFTKCTYTLATCSISCLLCRCGGTERLNQMVAACKLMRRAGGGCIGHSERILESGAHNLLHSTTQTSTKGQRSCIRGPRLGAVEPGQLGRVRARIDRVARKKYGEKMKRFTRVWECSSAAAGSVSVRPLKHIPSPPASSGPR